MKMDYAHLIKELRFKKNMTQVELAKGICSQALISKIEKNDIDPDIVILSKIANKLDVTVGYLIGEVDKNDAYVSLDYKEHVTTLLDDLKFFELENYIQNEKSSEVQALFSNKPYHLWLKAIILTNNYNQIDQAIELLNQALDLIAKEKKPSKDSIETKLEIQNTLANYYSLLKESKKAEEFFQVCLDTSELGIIDPKLKVKVLYGVARFYALHKDLINSTFYAQKAIQISTENKNFYLLEYLYLLIADNCINTEDFADADQALIKSRLIAEIKNNTVLKPYIERTAKQLLQLNK